MAGYVPHTPHVDADRRQDSNGTVAAPEPLVARHSVRQLSWTYDWTGALSAWHLRNTVRFSETPGEHFYERRLRCLSSFASGVRCSLLQRNPWSFGVAWHCCGDRC